MALDYRNPNMVMYKITYLQDNRKVRRRKKDKITISIRKGVHNSKQTIYNIFKY